LFDAENQIELNRYTIDSEKLEQSVEPIIKNIMTLLPFALSSSSCFFLHCSTGSPYDSSPSFSFAIRNLIL
ncbi:hypothetical protein SASC598P14_001600, partial [Snodgrassella alvi SCGC AB-598-P14]